MGPASPRPRLRKHIHKRRVSPPTCLRCISHRMETGLEHHHLEMQAHILSPGAMGRPSTHMYTGSCTSGLLGGVERLCGAWTPGFKALVWTENQSKESTKRPSQQQKQQSSQSTSLARLGSNVYSGPRTAPGGRLPGPRSPGTLFPCCRQLCICRSKEAHQELHGDAGDHHHLLETSFLQSLRVGRQQPRTSQKRKKGSFLQNFMY